MKPPVTPPATPATNPQTTPSTSMLEGHEIVHQACDHAHSAASPTVPIPRPASSPSWSGLSRADRSAISSTTAASAR